MKPDDPDDPNSVAYAKTQAKRLKAQLKEGVRMAESRKEQADQIVEKSAGIANNVVDKLDKNINEIDKQLLAID